MKKVIILSLLALALALPFKAYSQEFGAFGRTYAEVLEHHKYTSGVIAPTTDKLKDGTIVLNYKCTDDKGIGLQGFTYFFSNNICVMESSAFLGNFDYVFRKEYDSSYHYEGDNIWIDENNKIKVHVDMAKNGWFVYYSKL